jgi:hypothetical protein
VQNDQLHHEVHLELDRAEADYLPVLQLKKRVSVQTGISVDEMELYLSGDREARVEDGWVGHDFGLQHGTHFEMVVGPRRLQPAPSMGSSSAMGSSSVLSVSRSNYHGTADAAPALSTIPGLLVHRPATVMVVHVQDPQAHSTDIPVHESDEPDDLAHEFIQHNGLDPRLHGALSEEVRKTLVEVLQQELRVVRAEGKLLAESAAIAAQQATMIALNSPHHSSPHRSAQSIVAGIGGGNGDTRVASRMLEELRETKAKLEELQHEIVLTRREQQIAQQTAAAEVRINGAVGTVGVGGELLVLQQQNDGLRAECKRLAQQSATLRGSLDPQGMENIRVHGSHWNVHLYACEQSVRAERV